MENIYEFVVFSRLAFVNEAFDCYDMYNKGILEGTQRQIMLLYWETTDS